MDGMPAGITGALASHQVARQQSARLARDRREVERAGPTEASPDEADAPVEQADETPTITSHLPGQPTLRRPRDRDHAGDRESGARLDVTA